jgi:hypothetical protein
MRYCDNTYWQRTLNFCYRKAKELVRETTMLSAVIVCCILFSQILFALPLIAAEPDRGGVNDSGVANDPLLLKAAAALFPGIDGTLKISLSGETELYAQGLYYRMYRVVSGQSDVGEFTRITIFGNGGEMMDGAFRLSNGAVIKAVAVKPVSFSDSDDGFSLDLLLSNFKGIKAERYGVPVSTLFDGLSYLPSVLSGELEKKQKLLVQKPAVVSMKVSMPSPVLGEVCPHFSTQSVDGTSLSPFTFKDKPFLLFIGSLRNAMSVEMKNVLYEVIPDIEGKAGFIEAYENRNWLVMEQMRMGVAFKGRVVADPEGLLKKTLQVPYIPYLLGWDKEHKLIMVAPYKGRVEAIKALKDYFATVEKKGL